MRYLRAFSALTAILLLSPMAMGHQVQYHILLDGPSEAPPNSSPATGTGLVTVDLDLVTLRLQTTFSGLVGNTTAAHIHCCTAVAETGTAGVATQTPTFIDFPAGVKAGSYDKTFDMTLSSSFNATFISNNGGSVSSALSALLAGFDSGKAYLNIHTSDKPGGEFVASCERYPNRPQRP